MVAQKFEKYKDDVNEFYVNFYEVGILNER